MNYYEVLVSSQRYHSAKPLTYSSDKKLELGMVVAVPLQRQTVPAVVVGNAPKPAFATKEILRIIGGSELPPQIIKLLEWMAGYYPAPSGQIASLALPTTLIATSRNKPEPAHKSLELIGLPELTQNQKSALEKVQKAAPSSILLHGDTGTGKTRLYMELASKAFDQGRSAIVLTPEIGLTPQLAASFQAAFPGRSAVVHSGLTDAERRNIWLKILSAKEPMVVIGPRSALFSPLKNVACIIIDEFHETSYKQEQAPHYLTSRVAAKLAELHGAQLILGSATPPVSDYYAFEQKALPIVRMTEKAAAGSISEADAVIIDLKDKQLFSRSPWISDKLIEAIKKAIGEHKQSLVFLNRRGTARLVLCQVCGWQAACPNCDLPLTYHGDKHLMQCHTCGHTEKAPSACPECSANDIVFRSIGTKSLVSEIERLVPGAKVQRFDSDTNKKESLEQQYQSVKQGSADILVGTQMLGKGLDLPKLAVVGIITAETSLTFPDYTAEERTYQLITQALGRVNRGHTAGTAIVQTHHPDSPLLAAAIKQNYQDFYKQQIKERRLFKFPPFRYVLKLSCSRASDAAAKKASIELASKLRTSGRTIEISGPNPAFFAKTHNRYHWQIVVKAVNRKELVGIIKDLPANWSYDIDPMNLL